MATTSSPVSAPSTPTRPTKSLPSSPKTPSSTISASDRTHRRFSHPTTPLRAFAEVAQIAHFVRKLRRSTSSSDLIVCSSGPDAICQLQSSSPPSTPIAGTSKAPLAQPTPEPRVDKAPAEVAHTENFLCADAVDTAVLLRAARSALLERVKLCGGDTLMDEKWTVRIRGPKHGLYRVLVEYSAYPARTGRPDCGRPVALSKAKCVPGLMTVLERQ